jgi:hypothetical protein
LEKVNCSDVLKMDNSSPVVVQLPAGDKLETHAICIFNGRIYDSASCYVLLKTEAALNWCCGAFGFEAHMCFYRLEKRESKEGETKSKKAKCFPVDETGSCIIYT